MGALPAASDPAEIMSAAADLIWPLLLVGAIVLLYRHRKTVGPALREILNNRNVGVELPGIKLNIGGEQIPAQEAVDQQRVKTEDLRTQLSALAAQVAELGAAQGVRGEAETLAGSTGLSISVGRTPLVRRVLWVDDHPSNNAYEIAALKDRDVDVVTATSTDEAVDLLKPGSDYDAVVTDMRRTEGGREHPKAGIELIKKLRRARVDVPVVVYASAEAVATYGQEATDLEALGATASPTELLELLAVNYGPRFAERFERLVGQAIERAGWGLKEQPANSKFDFIAQRGDKQVAVEAKAWVEAVTERKFQRELDRLTAEPVRFRVLVVTPGEIVAPSGVQMPEGFELLPYERLEARLQAL